jgi:hypothetical protein
MAVRGISNVLDTTTAGWRKTSLDLFPRIINISPTDYPMFSMTGNVRTNNVTVTWQRRSLASRDFTSIDRVEGSTFAYESVEQPIRVSNTCAIFWTGVEVTGTSQAESHYGIRKLLEDQKELRAEEWKGHVEDGLINSVETSQSDAGNSAARQMDGLLAAITTNASDMNDAHTLSETAFIRLLKDVWESGPKARDVLVPSTLQMVIDKFDADGATKWIQTTSKEIVNMVLVYQSSFGSVRAHLSRDLQNGGGTADIAAIDFRFWNKAWLRTPHMTKPSIDGDYIRSVILGELSLKYDAEDAASKYTGVSE